MDLIAHALPHCIVDLGEDSIGWEASIEGIIQDDTYKLQAEYDNGYIENAVFVAIAGRQAVRRGWPPGASHVRRLEFAIYALPVTIIPDSLYGWCGRDDGQEFYNALMAEVP